MKAAWLSAACCALAVSACGGESAQVPDSLLGRWVSQDASYAGRSLAISQSSLVFASSATESENFAVRRVESHTEVDGSLAIAIAYGAPEADLTLQVHVVSTHPPAIRLGERAERWTQVAGSGRLP